jgi:asparagine synthase (glutamine-hydrolysing)
MISDVPIGAFLSGGIDSSTIVALMQQESARRIKTFSIGFHSKGFNEADFAKKVARHLGTEHTELYVSSQDLVDVIPLLPRVYDEPFCDSSQIPTYLVSKLTSGNVSVALSGDGGDELFCGYERYLWADSFWARVAPIPPQIRRKLSIAIGSSLAASIATRVASLAAGVPSSVKVIQKVETLSRVLRATNRRELYHGLVSHWIKDTAAERDVDALSTIFATYHANPRQEFLDEMMSLDLRSYLPDDILVKVDRASMAVSLEARTPFLDHRVIEFSLGLPTSFKVSNGRGKVILRKLLNRYVPSNLTDRPKMGFGVPISHWLRAELRPWAEELLSEQKLYRSGFLDPVPIRKRWQQHLAGTHNWEHHIWDILMLQSWLESHSSLSL